MWIRYWHVSRNSCLSCCRFCFSGIFCWFFSFVSLSCFWMLSFIRDCVSLCSDNVIDEDNLYGYNLSLEKLRFRHSGCCSLRYLNPLFSVLVCWFSIGLGMYFCLPKLLTGWPNRIFRFLYGLSLKLKILQDFHFCYPVWVQFIFGEASISAFGML